MNALITTGAAPRTMTSLELVEFINSERMAEAAGGHFAFLAHADFCKKVPVVLGEGAGKFSDTYQNPQNKQTYGMYRFPKREACLMAMSYSYDLQAKVYDRMTALETTVADPLAHLPAEQRALVAVMIDNAAIKAKQEQQAAALVAIESKVEAIEQTQLLTARPAGSESVSYLRPRAAKMFGLPERIVEQVIRQSPYAPRPAGMVKNERAEADGSSYVVYWIKDVNDVLRRFVKECKMVTPSFATHPMIDGRFKMVGGVK
jgi:hypothetical protein